MAAPKTTYIIDLPFNLSTYGKVNVIPDNDVKVWRNKVLSVFSVGTNERIWYHNYGANLSTLLFEPSSVAVEDARAAINEVFVSWLPELTLLDITAGYDNPNASVTLNLTYQIPSGAVDSVKIINADLTHTGETIEVTNG